jgi:thiol-disulfide isomerase/thioredoxin
MNKKVILALIFIILIGGIVTYFALKANNKDTETQQTISTNAVDTKATESTETQSSQYQEYSEESVASTTGSKLLFFHASWCPQCRQLDESIKNGQIPQGVTIFKVDYDSNQALRQKYGITLQTTVVKIDENGNLIKKYVAYDEPTLESVVNNIL